MQKQRVLLLSEGFGAGHTQAAYALSSSLRKIAPNVQTKVLELGSFLNPRVAPIIITAYKKTVSSQPRLIRMMYRSNYKKSLNRLTTLALHRIFYTRTIQIIRQLHPDVIVCTHPIPSAVISRLKRLGMLDVPLCTVITDYDVHGAWVSREVNCFLVSTDQVQRKLLERGVDKNKILITGIPVHPNFWERHHKEDIRLQFGLKDMPTVLVMGGGWGFMKDEAVNSLLALYREQIQIIFCFGSNEKSLEKMKKDPRFIHPNIHLLGFTKEIDKLMEVSDLLITKPGGMTCSEGLAKGIPMLFHKPLPGQEEENSHYFTQQGWGTPINSLDDITNWVKRLTEQYDDVVRKREEVLNHIALFRPMQSAQAIIDLLANTNFIRK
ncbi:UDP-N-acetylglucosamine--LPS N-acetylglucosamine transferase [Paenibacillus sp. DXFW5]|uniref:UDP-N-acetylglucosamine--LPS N-acetylglucosamine transferase n=1 Tax=Paenibacillus rhizolycopersici TaxID=2780073 RepID=A0ABS2HEG8_9BACL|nr:glycosyltransferase [Paenibacillus sp. J53TS2]MBM6997984.1 UDP-N-acetylglucosamine--LPS N-acetylglucosamine transferase [Paenibacillus rhizolycopersici]MUG87847.1 UDP-N-acetylglucosamine--LPS N-acetylglucosamine transferase [Paenibacillus timonensis]